MHRKSLTMVALKAAWALVGVWFMASGVRAVAWADAARPELVIRAGEIRLDGTIQAIDTAQSTLTLNVTLFTLSNGKTQPLVTPKPKTVLVTAETWLHWRGAPSQKVTLADLKAGAVVAVLGLDMGSGRDLSAREVAVENTAATGSSITAGGGQTSMPTNAMQEFAQQLADLKEEVERLKTARATAPVTAGAGGDAYITRNQVNELFAAMRREFTDSLMQLAKRVERLEAVAKGEAPKNEPTRSPTTPPG
ncbi:MAG: hypothetical protein M3347_19005 [Armatimonadota bacterium]|nr:hypothetical protein [Armatimonadota bacterium]